MLHKVVLDFNYWKQLTAIDEDTAGRVAAKGCAHCGGRLDRSDYPRKPRGGLIAQVCENDTRRISLCCDREGCRRRATPPSVRFGRKVYVGAVMVIACVMVHTLTASAARRASGISSRTVRRWSRWWQQDYPNSAHFEQARSRLNAPVETRTLPLSLWQRFIEQAGDAVLGLGRLLCFIAPTTTRSVADGSRFVRGGIAQ
jgi:hypothetical protein